MRRKDPTEPIQERRGRCQHCRGERVFFRFLNARIALVEWVCYVCRITGSSESLN